MGTRLDLQTKLEEFQGNDRVFFNPPESLKLIYPCTVYEFQDVRIDFADDSIYRYMDRYSITHIHRDPDNRTMHFKLLEMPYCRFSGRYIADGLYHDRYDLYF